MLDRTNTMAMSLPQGGDAKWSSELAASSSVNYNVILTDQCLRADRAPRVEDVVITIPGF